MRKKKEDPNQIAEKPAPPTVQRTAQPKKQGQMPVQSPGHGPMQLTPIIQPIAFVPYSTQEQPLYMYDEEEQYEDIVEEPVEEVAAVPEKRRVSGAAIALIIFSLVYIALYVISKFVSFAYINAINDESALALLISAFGNFSLNTITIIALAIAVGAVCCVFILIASIIRIMRPGACIAAKVFAFIALVVTLVAVLVALVQKETITINYGLYIFAAIALILVIIAFLARGRRKN